MANTPAIRAASATRERVQHLAARFGALPTHVGDEILGTEIATRHRRSEKLARQLHAERGLDARDHVQVRDARAIERVDDHVELFARLQLGHHDAGDLGRNRLGDVGREPAGRDRVDAHVHRELGMRARELGADVARVRSRRDLAAGRYRVLEIGHNAVRPAARQLGEHFGPTGGREQQAAQA